MHLSLPAEVTEVLERLEMCGFQAVLIGGVRDLLLKKEPHDWDIATSAKPEKIKEIFQNEILSLAGEKFGTIAIRIGETQIDVTTYRKEGVYSDSRHPDSIIFTDDLFEDLHRRDFTINAIAYDTSGNIYDYFCGQRDIRKRMIRAIGNAERRFEEDALRILRALRFSSVLGFTIEEETKKAIHAKKELIRGISNERLRSEFSKMLCGDNIAGVLMQYHDVFEIIIPEIKKCVGFDHKSPFHKYDVWGHTAHAVAYSPKIPEIRFALLFHDISKPDCFTVDESGRGHFYSHPKKSAVIAKNTLTRLCFPNKFINDVVKIVSFHDSHPKNDYEIKKILAAIGAQSFWQLTAAIEADTMAHAPMVIKKRNILLDKLKKNARRILSSGECYKKDMLCIDGSDIMQCGFKNAEIGMALDSALEAVISGKIGNDKEKLLDYIEKLYQIQ